MSSTGEEAPSVTRFREYLRIRTDQPDPDYSGCADFLQRQAGRIGLACRLVELVPGKPVVLMTWEGSDPSLPSLLLNSHVDVILAFADKWTHHPFEAVKDQEGNIYARGTQDMKSVGMQHLEAVGRLKEEGRTFKRTIHLCFVPEEEVGSFDGMAKFVKSQDFADLNVGAALDEGLASPTEEVPVYYGERSILWIDFTCRGTPGHASRFIENTAAAKVQYMTNKFLEYREAQRDILDSNPELTLGDVTSVNLTAMSGGVQQNFVPDRFKVGFDVRVAPTADLAELEAAVAKWVEEAGGDIDVSYSQKVTDRSTTSVAEDDPWFKAFKRGTDRHDLKVVPRIFPCFTDSRFLRSLGIPALGFSPMNHTPVLLHDHDEFINEKIFLRGIDIFEDVISEMASV